MAAASVRDNKAQSRFELDVEGAVAFANYRLTPSARHHHPHRNAARAARPRHRLRAGAWRAAADPRRWTEGDRRLRLRGGLPAQASGICRSGAVVAMARALNSAARCPTAQPLWHSSPGQATSRDNPAMTDSPAGGVSAVRGDRTASSAITARITGVRIPPARLEFGFQTDERHGNPNGVLHGGAVLAFSTPSSGTPSSWAAQRPCATISLDSRFIGTAAPGAWIGGRTTVRKLTPQPCLHRRRGLRRRQTAGHGNRDLPHLRGRVGYDRARRALSGQASPGSHKKARRRGPLISQTIRLWPAVSA